MTKVAFSFIKVPFYHTECFVGVDETVGQPGIRDAWRAREKSVPYSYSGSSNKPRTHEITTGATFEVIAIHVAHTHTQCSVETNSVLGKGDLPRFTGTQSQERAVLACWVRWGVCRGSRHGMYVNPSAHRWKVGCWIASLLRTEVVARST